MPTPIQRRAITEDLNPNWDAAEHSLRSAMEVIDWCGPEHIELAGLQARDLHTAMCEMPAERQGPADFLDVACALAAVTRARPKAVNADLLDALRELLAAELAQFPPHEAGKEAQDAWSHRRAAAKNNAVVAIAKATGAQP
jgi:hypothetical protein